MLLTTKNQLKIILLFKLENHLMIQIYIYDDYQNNSNEEEISS